MVVYGHVFVVYYCIFAKSSSTNFALIILHMLNLTLSIIVLTIHLKVFRLHFNLTINNFLLTEREVCTEKYRTEVFSVQTEPVGRGL